MAGTCFQNPIIRDGVSQQQRLVKALLPEYVAVDERKIEELKQFVLDFSKELQFFNLNDEEDGDWYDFFNKKVAEDQKTEPHYALFQAFLELFSIAQGDLNTLTGRHLDFYYKDVLRLKENPPVPDQVFIIMELAKHVSAQGHLVAEDTRLKAGKDELGNNVFYATQQDIVVNKATVSEIKNLYKDPGTGIVHQSDIANSADGQGAEIETDTGSWLPFGDNTRKASDIGFAFASPILNLAEGTRMVTLKLKFKEINASQAAELVKIGQEALNRALKFYFSGEEEWIGPSNLAETAITTDEIREIAERLAIQFLNNVSTWQEIAGEEPSEGPIYDSPWSGKGDQIRDYDIGETVAIKILEMRASLPNQEFTNLEEVRAVYGVGEDKINDLIYSFSTPSNFNSITLDVENRTLCLVRTIGREQAAIVPYNQEVLLDPFTTTQPVMKVILDTESEDPYVYNGLIDLQLEEAEITVDVSEVAGLVVQNDQTVMDPSKTMLPFGIIPVLGSTFYIGSREVFQKNLSSLDINLEWFGLPEEQGLEDYYAFYDSIPDSGSPATYTYSSGGRSNSSFKANVSIIDKRVWNPLVDNGTETLFASEDGDPVVAQKTISIANDALQAIPRDANLPLSDNFNTETQKGFVKIELAGTDFGHQQFQIAFTNQIIRNITNPDDVNVPNQPYNPILKAVSLNYRSSITFDCSDDETTATEKFFHVQPFGTAERVATKEETESFYFLPQFRQEGEIYIGLDNLTPPQNLSLLMQILEGSEDPTILRPTVSWAYLVKNEWVDFNTLDILSDTSNGLLTSGILNFAISKTASDDNTILTKEKHWLRASVAEGSGAIPEFVNAISQAVLADFEDNDNDPNYLSQALAAETISKLEFSDSSIKSIAQPFASFGGKVQEQSEAFYTRISERLRHKQRAISIWDYERMILQAFPSVYKVKCLNHTRYMGTLDNYNQLLPGHVSVIVVSNVQNRNAVNPIQPLTSLNRLEEIKAFIDGYRSDPITLHVQNPEYEIIRVEFKVRFRTGFDTGFYQRQLEDEIKAFLSPWAYSNSPDITFGGKIHQSRIIDFIDEREYVDYVTCFEMYHPATSVSDPVTEAIASTSASILCSAGQISTYGDHKITILEAEDNCDACEDNVIDPPPVVLSADSCQTEESIPIDIPEDPYSYSVPDLDLCPAPDETDLCGDTPEPPPPASLPCVLVHKHYHPNFGIGPSSSVYLLKENLTYIVPVYLRNSLLNKVQKVVSEYSILLKGNLTQFEGHKLENLWDIPKNPKAYTIWKWPSSSRPYFDGTNTRITFTEKHHIAEADKVNLFKTNVNRIESAYLPKVTQAMVDSKARVRIQVIANAGLKLYVRRAEYAGIDRLQVKGSDNTTRALIELESGAGLKLYSLEFVATAFDPISGYNDHGWKVTMENENYFKNCYAENEPDDDEGQPT